MFQSNSWLCCCSIIIYVFWCLFLEYFLISCDEAIQIIYPNSHTYHNLYYFLTSLNHTLYTYVFMQVCMSSCLLNILTWMSDRHFKLNLFQTERQLALHINMVLPQIYNLRSCSTIIFTTEKNPCISGPTVQNHVVQVSTVVT